ncbi:MAG: response regulator transcription factor [Amaricoccus sp.]|uniref:LuxR C-terminal-related transcriptional regulator n=1 Tax=Amaricoccus sp. TaxID=1872485 RepID=UPI0039E2C6CB
MKGDGYIAESIAHGHLQSTNAIRNIKRPGRFVETLVLIDRRTLERECFVRSIEMSHPRVSVAGFGSVDEWREGVVGMGEPSAILFNIGSREVSNPAVAEELRSVLDGVRPVPVIVVAESEELRDMIAAIDCGARGYIPASIGFEFIVEAMRLTAAGGMFLPSASVLSLRDAIRPKAETAPGLDKQFTSRQLDVVNALRRGKANKIIAFELDMSESTVKVHIRNIMKKLKATNRTEAAFKLNSIFGSDEN